MVNKRASRQGRQLLIGVAALLGLGVAFVLLGRPSGMLEDTSTPAGRSPGGLAAENMELPDHGAVSTPLAPSDTTRDAGDASGLDDPFFADVSKDATMPFTVRGSVVDQNQKPLVSANLQLVPDDWTAALVARVRAAEAGAVTNTPAAKGPTTTTRADGSFVFRTRRAREGIGEAISVYVDDPRCAKVPHECEAHEVTECDLGQIVVIAGAEIHGRVLDEQDSPIAGTRVSLEVNPRPMPGNSLDTYGHAPEQHEMTTTDAAGHYSFGQLIPASGGSITIEALGYRFVTLPIGPWEAGSSYPVPDITTDAGLALEAVIVDERDQPIDDAVVVACPILSVHALPDPIERLAEPGLVLPSGCRSASTSGHGHYIVRGLENEEYVLAVSAPGRVGKKADRQWPATDPKSITLEPRDPTATVVDLLVHNKDGTAIAAKLSFYGPIVPFTKPEPGHFRLDLATVKKTAVDIEASGFAPEHAEIVAGTGSVELELVRGSSVRGSVIDDLGEAVGGACLAFQPVHDEHDATAAIPRTLVADTAGRFFVERLAPGNWDVHAAANGYLDRGEPGQIQVETDADVEKPLTVVLTRCGTITGRVERPQETRPSGEEQGASLVYLVPKDENWLKVEKLDPRGNFVFTGLVPYVYSVWYGDGDSAVGADGIDIEAGQRVDVGPLRHLGTPDPSPGQARVIVFVHDGSQPIANAIVEWKFEESGIYWGQVPTDETGHATFPCRDYETIVVRARLPGGESTETPHVKLTPGEVRVKLIIASAQLSGTILDSRSGVPVPGATLILDIHGQVQANDHGAFVFTHVPMGEHTLSAKADGFLEAQVPVVLTAGKTAEQDIRLDPAARIRVIVLAPNEFPVAASVWIWPAEAEQHDPAAWGTRLDCGTDGRTETGLPPGSYRLIAQPLGSEARTIGWLAEHYGRAHLHYVGPGNTEPVILQLEDPPE